MIQFNQDVPNDSGVQIIENGDDAGALPMADPGSDHEAYLDLPVHCID